MHDGALDGGHGGEERGAEGAPGLLERVGDGAHEREGQRRARERRRGRGLPVRRNMRVVVVMGVVVPADGAMRRGGRRGGRGEVVFWCGCAGGGAGGGAREEVRVRVARGECALAEGHPPGEFSAEMFDGADKRADRSHCTGVLFVNRCEKGRRDKGRSVQLNRPMRSSKAAWE